MESLVVSIHSSNGRKIYEKITELATDLECYIAQARGQHLCNLHALSLMITGNWNNIAKLESALDNLATTTEFQILHQRCQTVEDDYPAMPYSVQVIATNQIGNVYNICQFFTTRNIEIETFDCEAYTSNVSDTEMLIANIMLRIPTITNIAELREEFLLYCEDLNVDGILEPEKR